MIATFNFVCMDIYSDYFFFSFQNTITYCFLYFQNMMIDIFFAISFEIAAELLSFPFHSHMVSYTASQSRLVISPHSCLCLCLYQKLLAIISAHTRSFIIDPSFYYMLRDVFDSHRSTSVISPLGARHRLYKRLCQ